jgi:hypothetical protein
MTIRSENLNNLQKYGGIAALLEAMIYVAAFIFFGAFWNFPSDADAIQKFAFLADHQTILAAVNLIMYVLFGALLAVLVIAIHERLQKKAKTLSQLAAVFGIIWVALVIASGMIANIGLSKALEISVNDPERALALWQTIYTIVEGLGGGNEVVGGLWVLLLSFAALKANELSKGLNYVGLFVGIVGILTIYPADVLTEIFGVSQIIWFFWIGTVLLTNTKN